MSSFALRFAVEVAFLGLLALAVGLAELATPWIVAVMVVGWVLVAVIEWLAWRSEQEPDDDASRRRSPSHARKSHVVGSRRDPRAAARGRQVSPVLVQRLARARRGRAAHRRVRRRALAGGPRLEPSPRFPSRPSARGAAGRRCSRVSRRRLLGRAGSPAATGSSCPARRASSIRPCRAAPASTSSTEAGRR